MSDKHKTPMTDKFIFNEIGVPDEDNWPNLLKKALTFAKKLERELREAREDNTRLKVQIRNTANATYVAGLGKVQPDA